MKDAKGHGSNARGAAGAAGGYPNIDKNLRGPGKHTGYSAAGDVWHIQKSNGPNSNWYSAVRQSNGDVVAGKGLGAISQKLQADSDAWIKQATSPAAGVAAQHAIPTDHLNGPSRSAIFDQYAKDVARNHAPGKTLDLRTGVGRRSKTPL